MQFEKIDPKNSKRHYF